MKLKCEKNEAYVSVKVEQDGVLTFRYGFNLDKPEGGFDPERDFDCGVAEAVGIIAGFVHMAQHHYDDLLDMGDSFIESGQFAVDLQGSEGMAEFMEGLTDEQLELLETPVKGEA